MKNNILAITFLQSQPDKSASILEQALSKDAADLLIATPHTIAGPVMEKMIPQYAARILEHLNEEQICSVLSGVHARHAAAILRYTDKKRRKKILNQMYSKAARMLSLFLDYAENMVGAWMLPQVLLVPKDISVHEALERIKNNEEKIGDDSIYLVDRDFNLSGKIHIADLLKQNPNIPISSLSEKMGFTLSARSTLLSVKDHEGWNSYNALPVLNKEKQIVGVLHHTDLHQGLNHNASGIKETKADNALVGLWSVYANVLLSLFDTAGGFGTMRDNMTGRDIK